MNKDNFLRLANVIELEDRFNLRNWAVVDGFPTMGVDQAKNVINGALCETTACVCGWVNSILVTEGHDIRPRSLGDEIAARKWLGITKAQSERLFFGAGNSVWVELAERFDWEVGAAEEGDCSCSGCSSGVGELVRWSDITATQAAKVLRMIASGEVEL